MNGTWKQKLLYKLYKLVTKKMRFTSSQQVRMLRWAEELESGKFQQGSGLLFRNEQYCCLGVCAVALYPNSWRINKENGHGYVNPLEGALADYGSLPRDIQDELGINESQGGQSLVSSFVAMNDRYHFTFQGIAQEIRSVVSTGYFTRHYIAKEHGLC